MADFVEVMKIKDRMCKKIKLCCKCPIGSENNGKWSGCGSFITIHPEQAQEILLKWAEEHPINTNADKFEEVFGFRPNIERCPMYGSEHCTKHECLDCSYGNFWKQRYKEPEVRE